MNYKSAQYFVVIVFICAILVLSGYFIYTLMKPDQNDSPALIPVAKVVKNKSALGYMYFTATPKDFVTENDAEHTSLFAFNVDSEETSPVIGTGVVQSFAPVPPYSGVFVYYDKTASGTETIRVGGADFKADQMIQFDTPHGWYESDLDVSPDGRMLVFSQMKILNEDPDAGLDINNWEVVIYSTSSDPIIIPKATHPQWVHDGADILFMKQGGIYKYNLETKDTTLLYDAYVDLTMLNDFTMSPDNRKLVITIPGFNLIEILKLSEDTPQQLTETMQITTPDVGYFYPVFAPDSESFAVNTLTVGNGGISPLVQIFNANTTEIIKSIELDEYKAKDFQLQAWGEVLVNRDYYDQ